MFSEIINKLLFFICLLFMIVRSLLNKVSAAFIDFKHLSYEFFNMNTFNLVAYNICRAENYFNFV